MVGRRTFSSDTALNNYLLDRVDDHVTFDVRALNVVGDGVADDTAVIQYALTTYGRIFVPEGTYKITTALSVPADGGIEGAGDLTVFAVPAASVIDCITLGNRAVLRHFKITGGGAKATNKAAISGTSLTDVLVENVTIDAYHGSGIRLVSPVRPVIRDCRITNITRSTGEGCAIRMTHTGSEDVIAPLIENCYTGTCAGTNIQLDAEWNRSDWRTAGTKVRHARVVNCFCEGAAFAGIFLNSAFDSTVEGCTARNNGDYGIGMEFCHSSTIDGCASTGNTNYGYAVMQGGQNVTVTGCTARGNTQHGFYTHYGGVVSGDTPTDSIGFVGCASQGNGGDGFHASAATRVTFTGCTAQGNTSDGVQTNSVDTVISGCTLRGNSAYGVNNPTADRLIVANCSIISNSSGGVAFAPTGANQAVDCAIVGTVISNNTGSGITVNADTVGLTVTGCVIDTNGSFGITGAARKIHIRGCTFKGNVSHAVNLTQPFDCDISDNTFYGVAGVTAINLPASGGFSGGRNRVVGNHIIGVNSTDVGIAASVGSNVSAGDDFYVYDNFITNAATPYSWSTIGTAAALFFRATVSGTPEAVHRGAIGSVVTRSDGGASTTLYVKESGANTTTGWVAK